MADPHYEDSKAAARANRAFYAAFEALDADAMRSVWSERDSIRCVHPGSDALAGPGPVHASWSTIFANTEAIRFEVVDLAIEVLGDVAWASNVERIRSEIGDRTVLSEAVATNLYAREDGRWRMILHHASPVARRFPED